MHSTTSQQWSQWLTDERHISLAVARSAGLGFTDNSLIIRVHDKDGKHIFNKYRRSPFIESDIPKYIYDKGASVALYGINTMNERPVIITESELDSLAMRTLGYNAVSSTGGAASFQVDWIPLFKDRDVTLMFDTDKAGVHGMLKTLRFLPDAKIAWLPAHYGKDVTEIIHAGYSDVVHRAISAAHAYPAFDMASKHAQSQLRALGQVLTSEYKNRMRTTGASITGHKLAFDWINEELHKIRVSEHASQKRHFDSDRKDVNTAKSTPIESIIKVNGYGFAKCVYHEESTPSMKVYRKDNRAYSYCCGKASDAIDIYCAVHRCTFKEAIEKMTI